MRSWEGIQPQPTYTPSREQLCTLHTTPRSEINALGNHRYLEKKWKAQFFFTSAWNYIKFATMRDTHSYSVDEATPDFVEDAGCFKNMLFFTWFEFIGMNHYDGKRLWALERDLCEKKGESDRWEGGQYRQRTNHSRPSTYTPSVVRFYHRPSPPGDHFTPRQVEHRGGT
jgi:hypothetical protein